MSTASITGVHPYADKFPMLPESELQELAESILQNGLRQPIVLTEDGLILDGRNRAKACEVAGVEPETVVYDGADLAEYVLDCNVTRRNMSTGARAMSTALVLESDGRRENGRWAYGAVQTEFTDIGKSTLRNLLNQSGIILDFKPNLAWDVVAGNITLNDAFQQADAIRTSAERDKIMERERRRREKEEAAAEAERNAQIVADLTQAESKYLTMIESGDMTPGAAWAAHRADHKKELDKQAELRRNAQERVRSAGQLLYRLHDFTTPEHRQRVIESLSEQADALPNLHREKFTPEHIRATSEALSTFSDELEASNV